MKRQEVSFRKRGWLAAFIGLIVVGMGQIYNGEFLKGVSFFIIFAITFITGFRLSVFLPDRYLMVGLALTLFCLLCIYTFTIIEAYRKASDPLNTHQLRSYNKWYFYMAIWMILAVHGNWAISHYVRRNFIQLFKIPTTSMQPKVLKGDTVIADKTAYSRTDPQREDIVVFIHPDYRSKI